MFYMDTNVFISRYKPDDPYHSSSSNILNGLEEGSLEGCTSTLTILEASCVASRMYDHRIGAGSEEAVRERGRLISALLKRLTKLNLVFIQPAGDTRFSLDGFSVEMPAIFNASINLSYRLGLKSLDSIHLAALMYSENLLGREVPFFVTGDRDFLDRRRGLREITGCTFIDPTEFEELLDL